MPIAAAPAPWRLPSPPYSPPFRPPPSPRTCASGRGEREYRDGCAVCHGMQGTGNGAIAALLTVPPPDLTALAAANGGAFPFGRVYRVIDGRAPVAGHGSSEMPVWASSTARTRSMPPRATPTAPIPS